jgi:hypothetical protein
VDGPDADLATLALVVVIQTSDISQSALLKVAKVGTMLQDAVAGANGQVAVVTSSDRVRIVHDFTGRASEISEVFQDLRPADTDEGRMLDARCEGTGSALEAAGRNQILYRDYRRESRVRIAVVKPSSRICCRRYSAQE